MFVPCFLTTLQRERNSSSCDFPVRRSALATWPLMASYIERERILGMLRHIAKSPNCADLVRRLKHVPFLNPTSVLPELCPSLRRKGNSTRSPMQCKNSHIDETRTPSEP